MLTIIFSTLGGLAILEIVALWWWQWRAIRSGQIAEYNFYPEREWQLKIDRWYQQFGSFFLQLGHYCSFYVLVFIRHLIVLARGLLALIERRFSRLIDLVHGRGVIHKRGAASLWLLEVKNHKQNLTPSHLKH